MRLFHSILCAGVLALTGTWLDAQVDPKLQACLTDVLDVYQGKGGAKPEVITLVDNSGSMEQLAWDHRYYANLNVDFHKWGSGDGDVVFSYVEDRYINSVSLAKLYWRSGVYVSDPYTRYLVLEVNVGTAGDPKLIFGRLVKPDGNFVTKDDVGGRETPNDWLQRASHVRFSFSTTATTYTYNDTPYFVANTNWVASPLGTSLDYNTTPGAIQGKDGVRVVDIPLPWAVFDRVPKSEARLLSPAPTGLSAARDNGHPQHMYLFDPVPSYPTAAQYYEVDTHWRESKSANVSLGGVGGVMVDGNGLIRPAIRFHKDYLWWCFFGQDVKAGSETGDPVVKYTGTNAGGYVIPDIREGGAAFVGGDITSPTDSSGAYRAITSGGGNGLPAMTRLQAVKYALIKTWISQQDKVWWCTRFLHCGGDGYQENGRSLPASSFSSSTSKGNPGDRMLLFLQPPTQSNNPDVNMTSIQRLNAPNQTPLTFALLNTYAQMADTTKGGTVFASTTMTGEGDPKKIPACRKSFVIVLSDGAPNDDDSNYAGGDGLALGSGDPFAVGHFKTSFNMSTIAPKQTNFNIWTLSGVVAHVTPSVDDAKTKTGWPTNNENPAIAVEPPFLIKTRVPEYHRRTNTIAIGISMTGRLGDNYPSGRLGPKGGMYKTALYGWESRGTFDPDNLPAPYDATNNDKEVNPFFFDAQSPDQIADALAAAMDVTRTVTNTMSAPVAPLVGLGVGNQMYLGTFTTGQDDPTWDGDLLTVGLRVVGNKVEFLHRDGNTLVGGVNKDSAIWSAADMLSNESTGKGWKNRNLWTLKPDATNPALFTKTLLAWKEITTAADLPNSVLKVATDAERRSLIRFMMGADSTAQEDAAAVTSITKNRKDMMGAIINSTPTILEFPTSKVPTGRLGSWMTSNATLVNKRFRVILVGDNQGIFHCFGEVSGQTSTGLLQAEVDELWGIIPPDILSGINTWRSGIKYRYMVDGSPIAYLNESGIPNGLVDNSDIVRVIFSLRKGGRSYYAVKFTDNDPTKPEIAWMLRPDDSTDSVVSSMGFSTGTPALARVAVGGLLRDVYLIGGGLTTYDVDKQYGKALGRSIVAVDVFSGDIRKTWDFTSQNLGCISTGVVPVEVIQGSYKAQRVYFTDANGGLYALGGALDSTTKLRQDTHEVNNWALRKVFASKYNQELTLNVIKYGSNVNSTAPAVFNMPYGYPAISTTFPKAVSAVGVAFGMGDRNDPMDRDVINPGGGGTVYPDKVNRFVVILDRADALDSHLTEDSLQDLTNVPYTADTTAKDALISPNSATYYLNSKPGYYLNFNSAKAPVRQPGETTMWFYEKMVVSPIVLNGSLFFTIFGPETTNTDPCISKGGTSTTYRMANVLNPEFNNGTRKSTELGDSGYYHQYNDIPSELASVGLGAVLQVGEVRVSGEETSGGVGTVAPIAIPGSALSNLPRPRAWRIIR